MKLNAQHAINNKRFKNSKDQKGFISMPVLVYTLTLVSFATALTGLTIKNFTASQKNHYHALALQAAEAGA